MYIHLYYILNDSLERIPAKASKWMVWGLCLKLMFEDLVSEDRMFEDLKKAA